MFGGNWPGFDRFFPEDFYSFQYPEGFQSNRIVNDIRKKRQVQNTILKDRELLENALNTNDNKNLPMLANNLALSKQKLADLSRSSSSLEIIDQADQTLNKYKKSLGNSYKTSTSRHIPITSGEEKKKKSRKRKRKNGGGKTNKNATIQEEEEDIPVETHNMNIDNNEESNDVSNVNENINENVSENINETENKDVDNDNDNDNDNDINNNTNTTSANNTTTTNNNNNNKNIENDITNMDVDIDNPNKINKEKEETEEEETIKKIENICNSTKKSLDNLKKFSEKSNQLLKELQLLKKEYYDLDTTIFNAILDLDKLKTHGKSKELRKKTLAYYTSALKQLDDYVQPLNEFDLKFKSKV